MRIALDGVARLMTSLVLKYSEPEDFRIQQGQTNVLVGVFLSFLLF